MILKNIKISDEENSNWNSQLVHFQLQNPNFLYNLIDTIIGSSKELGIEIELTKEETYLLKKYEVLLKNGDSKKD